MGKVQHKVAYRVLTDDGGDTIRSDNPLPVQSEGASTSSYGVTSVGTSSPVQLDDLALANRFLIEVANPSPSRTIFLGFDDSLTAANGFPIPPEEERRFAVGAGPDVEVWAITEAGTGRDVQRAVPNFVQGVNGGPSSGLGNIRSSDGVYCRIGTTQGDGVDLFGFIPARRFSAITEVSIAGLAGRGTVGGTDPQLDISYSIDGVAGATTDTWTLTTTVPSTGQFFTDITADEVWTPSLIESIEVRVVRGGDGGAKNADVDVVYLRVVEEQPDDSINVRWIQLGHVEV